MSGTILLVNNKRDTKDFGEVWNTEDGQPPVVPTPPTADASDEYRAAYVAALAKRADCERVHVKLGSSDDDNDLVREFNDQQSDPSRRILMPSQEYPGWVLKHLEAEDYFKFCKARNLVRVLRPA